MKQSPNRLTALFATALAMVFMASVANATGVKTLFLADFYDNGGIANTMSDVIGSDARFDQGASTYFNMNTTGLPSLAYLQSFDSVLVWTDSLSVDLTILSDTLKSYVDSGGGVVLSTFWGQQVAGAGITTGINSTGYNPLINYDANAYTSSTLGVHNALDPLMQGVSSISATTYRGDYLAGLDIGAVLVASWADGKPLAAYNGAANVAYISLTPPDNYLHHVSGDHNVLFANALAFVGGATSSVPDGGSTAIFVFMSVIAIASCKRKLTQS